MPSVFRTHFKAVGFPALLALHGEPIVYLSRKGGTKPFNAIVVRRPVELYGPGGEIIMAKFTIRFHDSCVGGMESTDIDTGGDVVELLANEGDDAKTRVTVLQKTSQSNGVIELALA